MEDQYIYIRHTDLTEYDDAQMISQMVLPSFMMATSSDGGGWTYITFDSPFPTMVKRIEMVWQNRDGTM